MGDRLVLPSSAAVHLLDAELTSVARNVGSPVTVEFGTPLMSPVALFSDSPEGRFPAVCVQV